MIVINSDVPLKIQLQNDIKELEGYKDIYIKKVNEDKENTNYSDLQKMQETNTLSNDSDQKIEIYNMQVAKINRNLEVLNNILENIDNLSKNEIERKIKKYNHKYTKIKSNITINKFIHELDKMDNIQNNSQDNQNLDEEIKEEASNDNMKNVIIKENIPDGVDNDPKHIENISNRKIQNNDTLLISEILNSVVLPYTAEEVLEILEKENEKYKTAEEVIKDKFTRSLSDYKSQFLSRYKETIKLLTLRQDYKLKDSIALALEVMKKRFLHPAIISACRNLDELDVYLDCLDKNEVDDFKIFKIKYELHPVLVKNKGVNKKKKLFKLFSMKPKSKEI